MDIDLQIKEWIELMRAKNIELSQDVIINKANELAGNVSKASNFSTGWFYGFIKRFNISRNTFSGESKSVNNIVIEKWKTSLSEILKNWEPKDIFNTDETGRGYVFANDVNKHGCKQSKKRISILFTCSMLGEKLDPLVIGKFSKPRCFKSAKILPLEYEAITNAWMTEKIFSQFLIKWKKKLISSKRKILLFLDNCASHPNLNLSNITLCFFPPNTTSVLQPLDQGIINNVKIIYKKHLMDSLIQSVESGITKHEPTNILEAMFLLMNAWDQVKTESIVNCFKKSFFETCENEPKISALHDLQSIELKSMKEEEAHILTRNPEFCPVGEVNSNNIGCSSDSRIEAESDNDSLENDVNVSDNEIFKFLSHIRKYFRVKSPQMLKEITKLDAEFLKIRRSKFRTPSITNYFKNQIS